MHSNRMLTARSLPSIWTETPLDRDPPDIGPHGQRLPGQRPPDRDPLDRDTQKEHETRQPDRK